MNRQHSTRVALTREVVRGMANGQRRTSPYGWHAFSFEFIGQNSGKPLNHHSKQSLLSFTASIYDTKRPANDDISEVDSPSEVADPDDEDFENEQPKPNAKAKRQRPLNMEQTGGGGDAGSGKSSGSSGGSSSSDGRGVHVETDHKCTISLLMACKRTSDLAAIGILGDVGSQARGLISVYDQHPLLMKEITSYAWLPTYSGFAAMVATAKGQEILEWQNAMSWGGFTPRIPLAVVLRQVAEVWKFPVSTNLHVICHCFVPHFSLAVIRRLVPDQLENVVPETFERLYVVSNPGTAAPGRHRPHQVSKLIANIFKEFQGCCAESGRVLTGLAIDKPCMEFDHLTPIMKTNNPAQLLMKKIKGVVLTELMDTRVVFCQYNRKSSAKTRRPNKPVPALRFVPTV